MTSAPGNNPVFCAVDTTDIDEATHLVQALSGHIGGIKLGLEFFCANGPSGIAAVTGGQLPLFLDLKLHDIPNTVAGAMRAVARSGATMTTIHAVGGAAMIRAARDSAETEAARLNVPRVKILAVTVLTSLNQDDLGSIGVADAVSDQAKRLAALAQNSGADGVICSPHEVAALRAQCGSDFLLVVPGIRPAWSATNDQKRIMTPREAMDLGASHLVIGRPITAAADPLDAARKISAELSA